MPTTKPGFRIRDERAYKATARRKNGRCYWWLPFVIKTVAFAFVFFAAWGFVEWKAH